MKKVNFFALMCCAAFGFAACDDDCDECNPQTEPTEAITFVGTMDVEQADGSIFSQENITVDYVITEEGATISFYQVKFAERMPVSLDMEIKNVEFIEEGNAIVCKGNNIIPIAMGGEFPNYTITNLTGIIENETMSLSMTCGSNPVVFTGSLQ